MKSMEIEPSSNNQTTNIVAYLSTVEKTLLIACLTFLGYLDAYIYKISYLSFYDIPLFLTKVKLEDVIFSAIGMIIISTLMGIFVFFLISLSRNPEPEPQFVKSTLLTTVIVSTLLFGLIAAFVLYFVLLSPTFKIIALLILFLLYTIGTFGLPIYLFRGEKSIKMRFRKYYEKINIRGEKRYKEGLMKQRRESLFDILLKPPFLGLYVYFISIITSMLLAAILGTTMAANKESFYILNENNQSFFMAEMYEDQLVLVAFDEQKKVTTGIIQILPISDFKKLNYRNTGKLNVYKTIVKR